MTDIKRRKWEQIFINNSSHFVNKNLIYYIKENNLNIQNDNDYCQFKRCLFFL